MSSSFLYVVIIAAIVTKSQPQRIIGQEIDPSKCLKDDGNGYVPDNDCIDCSKPPKQLCADRYIMKSSRISQGSDQCSKITCKKPVGWYNQRVRMEEFEKVEKQMPNRPPPVQRTIRDRYGERCRKGYCDPLLNETITGIIEFVDPELINTCLQDSRCSEYQIKVNSGSGSARGHLCLGSENDQNYRNNTEESPDETYDTLICRLRGNVGIHISADPCRDLEPWCSYDPNCDHKEVQIKCSKHCKTCSSKCDDLKNWCKFEPKCDVEDVRKNCPKWCRICAG